MRKHFFEEETGDEPIGRKVQTDYIADVKGIFAVVPWAKLVAHKESTAYKFSGENQAHIDKPPDNQGGLMKQLEYGFEKGCAAVNGEHPEGCGSYKAHVAAAEIA